MKTIYQTILGFTGWALYDRWGEMCLLKKKKNKSKIRNISCPPRPFFSSDCRIFMSKFFLKPSLHLKTNKLHSTLKSILLAANIIPVLDSFEGKQTCEEIKLFFDNSQ